MTVPQFVHIKIFNNKVIQVHCDRSVYLSDESLQPTALLERDYVVVIIFYFFGNNPVHCTFIQDASYHTFSITIRNHSLKVYTSRSHEQGHDMLPIHVQLHTYTHTYKYVWQEPRIRLQNNSTDQ